MTMLGFVKTDGRGGRLPRWLTLALAAAALPVAACSLDVTDPDIITPDNLQGASALPTIRAAAIGDFALSYSGSGADGSQGTEGITMMSGLLGDEWVNSETFPTRIEIDRRSTQVTNGTLTGWFRTISRARRSAEFAADRFRALSDTLSNTGYTEMLSLSGFTYLWFAENWCSGVPISTASPDGSLVFGQPLTTQNLVDSAVARFRHARNVADSMSLPAAAKATVLNLARVGLGRALLDSGAFANAAVAVASVPSTFTYNIQHSLTTNRENNGVFVAVNRSKRYSVADREGINGLPYRSAADPRLPFVRGAGIDSVGFDGTSPQWNQLRFQDQKAFIPLATGVEARLIEAEAALHAPADTTDNAGVFYGKVNGLRTNPIQGSYYWQPPLSVPPPLAALTTDSATAYGGAVRLLFRERAFWMWMSAHRLGDMRRLARQYASYGDSVSNVFPIGPYQPTTTKGGVYGPDVNFPVPFEETNNPNFTQCLDRNP
ncbi:MAG: hypothetical protein DMD68_02300 [Gemmatimonadetes bacterium]|nr:MAG: hypothetical protein DMD68_02300 [Gemmatimonadota bacterium]